jgi:phosphopantothenoylcysteine decarboxylase/phosphopantothenate--cysteine ligase
MQKRRQRSERRAATRPRPGRDGKVRQAPVTTSTPHDPLHGKRVVLCVTGGIAAYKSAYLTRLLVKAGAQVIVVMSEAASRFVAPLTFETLSGNPVVTSTFERAFQMGAVEHIDLATWADLVIVAPATYNVIGKLHAGVADDAVTTFLTAVTVPVFLVPAMNAHMWRNPIQQRNVRELVGLGYLCIEPERGGLACSWEGEGRMQEPDAIVEHVRARLRAGGVPRVEPARADGDGADARGSLAGRTVLITLGGTQEAIDPVRFIGNRSSGRTGHALARSAMRRGARVFLVSGPTVVAPPPDGLAGLRRVESAQQMLEATRELLPGADVLLMAAAVADYRPRTPATAKIKRDAKARTLDLEPTPDVLAALRAHKQGRLFVGFALETQELAAAAPRKLQDKGVDLLVANRVGPDTGPDAETNQVAIFDAEGLVLETPVLDKDSIAEAILDVVEQRLAGNVAGNLGRRDHGGEDGGKARRRTRAPAPVSGSTRGGRRGRRAAARI